MTNSELPITGIIGVSGGVGVGKTSFALGIGVPPQRIAYWTWDVKRTGVEDDFGQHYSFLGIQQTGTELDMCNEVHAAMMALKPGEFDVLILDAWELFVATIIPFILKNEKKLKTHWFGGGEWKQRQMYGYAGTYEAAVLENLQAKVPLIIALAHVDYRYVDIGVDKKVKTGKKIPKFSKSFRQKALAMFFLQRNSLHPMPTALVLKNLAKRQFVPGTGIQSVNVLPPRLDQRVFNDWESRDYISLWDIIRYYFDNPVGTRSLRNYEIPNEYERSFIEETLTKDEKEALEFNKHLLLMTEMGDEIKGMYAEGVPLPLIAQKTGTTIEIVKKIIGE